MGPGSKNVTASQSCNTSAAVVLASYVITPALPALRLRDSRAQKIARQACKHRHHAWRGWPACTGHADPCLTRASPAGRRVTDTPGRPSLLPTPCPAAAQPGASVRAGAASAPPTHPASVQHPEGRPWRPAGAAQPGQAGGAGLRLPGGCARGGSAACTTGENGGSVTGGLQAMSSHLELAHMGNVVLQRGKPRDGSMPEGSRTSG